MVSDAKRKPAMVRTNQTHIVTIFKFDRVLVLLSCGIGSIVLIDDVFVQDDVGAHQPFRRRRVQATARRLQDSGEQLDASPHPAVVNSNDP